MKKIIPVFMMIILIMFCLSSCSKTSAETLINSMTENEKSSIQTLSETEFLVYDDELERNFLIQMTLPPNYDRDNEYPLFLVTDGVWSYEYQADIYSMMEENKIKNIILVSLSFNPDEDNMADETRYYYFVKNNKAFLDFITDNLMPVLSENYKIDYSQSTFGGHSLGGLFCHYALFNSDLYDNQPFGNYLVSSPALSVENSALYRKYSDLIYYSEDYDISYEKTFFERNGKLDKSVYLTCEGDMVGAHKDHIKKFDDRAKGYDISEYEYEYFPDYDHFGLFKEALESAVLKFYGTG